MSTTHSVNKYSKNIALDLYTLKYVIPVVQNIKLLSFFYKAVNGLASH